MKIDSFELTIPFLLYFIPVFVDPLNFACVLVIFGPRFQSDIWLEVLGSG